MIEFRGDLVHLLEEILGLVIVEIESDRLRHVEHHILDETLVDHLHAQIAKSKTGFDPRIRMLKSSL
jgi:hypothetical protein